MRIGRATLLPAIILLLPVLAFGNGSDSDPKAAIERALHQQQDAWNRHDLNGFMSGYWNSPELTFFSGAKISAGWQSALAHYRTSYQGQGKEMGHLEFSRLNVQPLGFDTAFVRGSWALTVSGDKQPHGVFTLVFRKFPEGWKIIHDHTSTAEE
jgi:ketosteroid isomerase-like protein